MEIFWCIMSFLVGCVTAIGIFNWFMNGKPHHFEIAELNKLITIAICGGTCGILLCSAFMISN